MGRLSRLTKQFFQTSKSRVAITAIGASFIAATTSVSTFASEANASYQLDWTFSTSTVASDLHKPWGIAALDDDLFLITERDGKVRLWDNKNNTMSPADETFTDFVFESGQGGMLDVLAHPNFAENNLVYLTYSAGHRLKNATRLSTAEVVLQKDDNGMVTSFSLKNKRDIFTAQPFKAATYHFAGRLVFMPDGTLVFGVGDGYTHMDKAQTLDNHFGKVIRINDDGSVPADNPYVEMAKKDDTIKPEIYSYGHRNPQGMYYDASRSVLFSNEHGPKGGDEINIIKPELNYGWPKITYGIDYSGSEITPHSALPEMQQPLVNWTPSIAPSSMLVYEGDLFPALKGKLVNTSLKFQEIRVVELKDKAKAAKKPVQQDYAKGPWQPANQWTFFKDQGERLRDIVETASGQLLIVTDSGKLIRLDKA